MSSALPELLKGGLTRGIQGSAADRPQFAGRKGVRHRLSHGLPGDDDPPEVCGVAGRTDAGFDGVQRCRLCFTPGDSVNATFTSLDDGRTPPCGRVESMTVTPYRRRVGSARPSHLMFTDGVGGLLELPNFSVLVRGLDEWNYSRMPERPVIPEPRLLAAVRSELSPGVRELRAAPWLEGQSEDPNGPAGQVGVPVIPFPAWFRCTRCNQLQSLESGAFSFTNLVASRPFEAQFLHKNCARKDRYAVPARFLVACLKATWTSSRTPGSSTRAELARTPPIRP